MNSYFKLVLFTASILALAFTISCSGDDGKDGTSCVLAENVLTCGSTSYTLPEGAGGPGQPGASCVPNVDGNGSVWIECGTAAAIMVSCGGSPFNSKTQICDDRDGNAYKFVDIDGQIWLAENVKFKTANSACYGGLPSNCAKYGRLYTWTEAKEACPSGWSLPDTTKFAALISSAGENAGKNLKSEEVGGTDSLGFGALLGGYKTEGFTSESTGSRFWSNTEEDSYAYDLEISEQADNSKSRHKSDLYSVRCIKED